MKLTVTAFIMAIIFFSTSGWSEGKDLKIPAQPAKKQGTQSKTRSTTKKSDKIITIQVGSFKTLKNARREATRLKSYTANTIIRRQYTSKKVLWHVVYIGKFGSTRDATSYAKKLKKRGVISSFLVKSITPTPKKITAKKSKSKKGKVAKSKRQQAVRKSPTPNVAAKSTYPGRFSLGLRAAGLIATSASDFRISKSTQTPPESWEFKDYKPLGGIYANLRISDRWSIEAMFEQSVFTNVEMQFLSLGPKFHFGKEVKTRPYLRIAMVYGTLNWDEAPGDFDSTLGPEIAIGFDSIRSQNFSIGIDAAYRQMTFDYNSPSDPDVSATASEVDYSGFILSAIMRYHF